MGAADRQGVRSIIVRGAKGLYSLDGSTASKVSEATAFIQENGELITISNQEVSTGRKSATYSQEGQFVSLAIADDKILVGTSTGSLLVYDGNL